MSLPSIPAAEAARLLAAGVTLVDIREADERARSTHEPEGAHPSSLCNPPRIRAHGEQALLTNEGI
jgi:rhodanese-related sulfurtransferase